MRLTVLGSGTLLPDPLHTSPAHWVEFGDVRLLLDCGAGALHGMARERLAWSGLSHLLITHLHTDHVGDLAAILWALRHGIRPPRVEEPLVLLGPRGLRAHLDALAAAHGRHVHDPGFPVQIRELAGGDVYDDPGGRFTIRTHGTPHTDVSLAVRVESPSGTVGYTGDTGPSAALGAFFHGVGALISECSLADPAELTTHLSPRSLAELAGAAAPGLLLVTHLYPTLSPHQLPDLIREAGYVGELLVANDGTKVEIEGGGARLTSG
jgi:ribonuclease BN (tRNA processing enzyme)